MLNMQNVKDIEITEGNVRTIHDKDNKLIWGRLAYDTKYVGDTEQQTYTGKNLVDYVTNKTADGGGITISVGSDGIFTVTGVPTVNFKKIVNNFSINSILEDGATYTLSKTEDTNLLMPQVALYNKSTGTSTYINVLNTTSESFVVDKTTYDYQFSAQTYTTNAWGEYSRTVKMGFMLEKSATATAFEPYVGGIPSPNPDYPQDVNVVTGTQTVTLSDGVDSEDYTISLGTTELCKIGTYQDYIYKDGDEWYVHKAIDKVILNGSETWGGGNGKYSYSDPTIISQPLGVDAPPIAFSNYLAASNYTAVVNDLADNIIAGYYNGGQFRTRVTSYATVNEWKTWLTTHNLTVYYQLATPTDTQITDTNLIAQLNAIHQFLTRYGYNSNVSGNLPIIINQTSL